MKTKRAEEIASGFKSFQKPEYYREEVLPELFALQSDCINAAFNGTEGETENLRIWDVVKHFEQQNAECNHIFDEEVRSFKKKSEVFSNLIKSEISGKIGEQTVFKYLEHMQTEHFVIKNLGLSNGMYDTEIDAIVITPKCLYIIEAKNSCRNIYIDIDGNYSKNWKYMHNDRNLLIKTRYREAIVSNILEQHGWDNVPVQSIVAFSNNQIEVLNKCIDLKVCYASQLPSIIDDYSSSDIIDKNNMQEIKRIIESMAYSKPYPFEFDARQYILDFANLLATLEHEKSLLEAAENKTTTYDTSYVTATINDNEASPKTFLQKASAVIKSDTAKKAMKNVLVVAGAFLGGIALQNFYSKKK